MFLIDTDPFLSILLLGEIKMCLNIDLERFKNYINSDSYSEEDLWVFFAKINITKLTPNLHRIEKRDVIKVLLDKMEFSDFSIRGKSGKDFPVHRCIIGLYFLIISLTKLRVFINSLSAAAPSTYIKKHG